MKALPDRTQAANNLLAPYAVLHSGGLGRQLPEADDETRFRFQRDRGRIVHTQAFRRLKGKTQVFVGGGGDHYRTRLTHTLEVAGISRDIARTLSLNEDLAECIALAHDLGHPPFGHAGENALNEWMGKHQGNFEHNLQSYRIVTELAEHSAAFAGLNLNQEILDGLLKHSTPHDHPPGVEISHAPSLEAQVVNIADEIAYTAHDCEDGLSAELFSVDELSEVSLAHQGQEQGQTRGSSVRGALIHLLVMDLYAATAENLTTQNIETIEDVYAAKQSIVDFSSAMRTQLNDLREFLWQHMYNHALVIKRSQAGQTIITGLCDHLYAHPTDKIQSLEKKTSGALHEAVKDYVSGMTDSYAFWQAKKLGVLDQTAAEVLGHPG